ncbi:hypothetical protein E4P41_09995 [Geodermatophilus sp. DF01-2]|uniref:hypothetical protein n=1 Tax=Geodermatophilus sp. DF01-2 TaxID=2559610 RepID=UPI00107434A7|nr:hypothetical protein [Geodermatophilus sp. DF01_2]TFV61239.1 hypothetical protein E4P41_09995 [Geodermatophilus sp. DF01_2]
MRVSLLVYGVLYVVVEIVGAQIEAVGWPQLTALDVATAVANACLTVAVGIAVLVGLDVGGRRWRRSVQAWQEERTRLTEESWDEQTPITVTSWRPEPLALPAGTSWRPVPRTDADYAVPSHGRPFPEESGRLL